MAEGGEVLRWYPDVVSLRLIGLWTMEGTVAEVPEPTPQGVARAISGALDLNHVPQLDHLGAAAVVALEAESKARIPTAIAAVASGDLAAVSLPTNAWNEVCRGAVPLCEPARLSSAWRSASSGKTASRAKVTPTADLSALLSGMDAALEQNASRTSAGATSMKAALRDLRQAHGADWPVVDALASWYLYLLRKSRKPSTIRTYHSTVGRRLLLVFADEDPMSCDPAVLGLRYEQVLRLSLAKNLQYATGRLAQFAGTPNVFSAGLPPRSPTCAMEEMLPGGSCAQHCRLWHPCRKFSPKSPGSRG